jgi:hypothetical protein
MAWWKRASSPAESDDWSTVVVTVLVGDDGEPARVRELAAAWSGTPVSAPGSVACLAPGVYLGGPVDEGGRAVWHVVAARAPESGEDSTSTFENGDSTVVLVEAVAMLAQAWVGRRPLDEDDLVTGAPAFACAFARGLARRVDGSLRLDGGPEHAPQDREATRVVYLPEWVSPSRAAEIVAPALPGLACVEDVDDGDDWVADQPGGFGLVLSARDDESVVSPSSAQWAADAAPDVAPLLSTEAHHWTLQVEGPDDVATPTDDARLDAAAALLAAALGGFAVDLDGFPVRR